MIILGDLKATYRLLNEDDISRQVLQE